MGATNMVIARPMASKVIATSLEVAKKSVDVVETIVHDLIYSVAETYLAEMCRNCSSNIGPMTHPMQ
jgi:hypothetical protein